MQIKTCHPPLLPIKHLEYKKIISVLGEARDAIARLDEKILQEKQSRIILEPLFWQESISSLRSQNIHTIFQEVMLVRFAGIASEKRSALIEKIISAKEALDYTVKERNKKIGEQLFCHIHRIIKKNSTYTRDIGRIRDRQNWIGPEGCKIEEAYFYPPLAKRIRPLLRNLESYLAKQDLDPLLQIAIAFAQFLIIHPFMDGNGRVARMLVPVCAFRKKLMNLPALLLSEYFETHREDYFQKLFHISEHDDWEDWIVFFLAGAISQAKKTRCRIDALAKLWHDTVKLSSEKQAKLLFCQPLVERGSKVITDKLIREKFLIAQGEEHFFFEPLIRAMRD